MNIRSVITHGCKNWTLRKKSKNDLDEGNGNRKCWMK